MTIRLDLDMPVAESRTRRDLLEISRAVVKCKKIVVVTGAGISCSAGIPDFRSQDGLYSLVKDEHPDVILHGRDLFDASLFRDKISTAVFYTFISKLKKRIDKAKPTPTHRFIKALETRGKLLRSYTQNVDGLEEHIKLRDSSGTQENDTTKRKSKSSVAQLRHVRLHGDIRRVRCTTCSANFPFTEEYVKTFKQGIAPDCPECRHRLEARLARSARPIKVGALRPAIVLYSEVHPLGDDIGAIQTLDIGRKPDMLIIMGTSLQVHGVKKLVKDFAKAVHASKTSTTCTSANLWQGKVVFVNKTPPGSEWKDVIDYHVSGNVDDWVEMVVTDWKKTRPSDWEVQKTLDDGVFKVVKKSACVDIQKKPAAHKLKTFGEDSRREDMTACSPNPLFKPSSSTPSSPVKRRQPICHYSDVESSPRKRRGVSKLAYCLGGPEMAGRRLQFLDTTNSSSTP